MSTLLTSMETIVNPTPWLDRPRNAAKAMAYANTLLGIIAILPNLMGIYLSLWGYILCFGYWRIALGISRRPEWWWKFSLAYNGLLGALTAILFGMNLPDGGEDLHLVVAILAWQLLALHLSLRGLRADVAWGRTRCSDRDEKLSRPASGAGSGRAALSSCPDRHG